mmetsp:Transcript_10354/g.16899  ORF Transcript_10354/g.16899 Transcript_10354/m.16899 type:complete len:91 (+) Transcript_10354:1199-1471(+)
MSLGVSDSDDLVPEERTQRLWMLVHGGRCASCMMLWAWFCVENGSDSELGVRTYTPPMTPPQGPSSLPTRKLVNQVCCLHATPLLNLEPL